MARQNINKQHLNNEENFVNFFPGHTPSPSNVVEKISSELYSERSSCHDLEIRLEVLRQTDHE